MSNCTIACASAILKQLPKEAINALISLSSSAAAALSVTKIQKQIMSINMDIQLAPLLAKKSIVDKAIGSLQQQIQVIPTNLVLQCPPLGGINTSLRTVLLGPVENVLNISFDIDNLTNIKSGIQADIAGLDSASAFFNSIVACANEALSST